MPNLDPATRARLADALEGATPEEISAFARIALDRAMFYRSNEGQRIYLTLAALALAVAKMQERGERYARASGEDATAVQWWVFEDGSVDASPVWDGQDADEDAQATLPAALADFIRKEGA